MNLELEIRVRDVARFTAVGQVARFSLAQVICVRSTMTFVCERRRLVPRRVRRPKRYRGISSEIVMPFSGYSKKEINHDA
jgi:hypothetical protein